MNSSVRLQEKFKLKVMLMEKDETDTNVGQRGMRWQEVTAISPPSANVPTKFSSKNISLE